MEVLATAKVPNLGKMEVPSVLLSTRVIFGPRGTSCCAIARLRAVLHEGTSFQKMNFWSTETALSVSMACGSVWNVIWVGFSALTQVQLVIWRARSFSPQIGTISLSLISWVQGPASPRWLPAQTTLFSRSSFGVLFWVLKDQSGSVLRPDLFFVGVP